MTRTRSQDRWLRFFNDVLYESYPAIYNLVDPLTLGAWWRLVQRAMEHVPPASRVLEIGHGTGRLQVELARRANFCLGLDLTWGMCHFTQRRLRKEGLPSRLVQGSVFALPYPANTFDVVVSTFAFSGFSQGGLAIKEMARVTRFGGKIVLVDIGLPANQNRLGTILARMWERMGDTLYDYRGLMAEAGLVVLGIDEYGPGDHIRLVVGERR